MDPRYKDANWVANCIAADNNDGRQVWSARFEFPQDKVPDALAGFTNSGMTARIDGGPAFVVVEFGPGHQRAVAAMAVSLQGVLCKRLPANPLGPAGS